MSRRILVAALALAVCKPVSGGTVDPTLPVAEAYDHGSDFAGAWVGESNGILGLLEVREQLDAAFMECAADLSEGQAAGGPVEESRVEMRLDTRKPIVTAGFT